MALTEHDRIQLAEEAQRIREAGALGRSDVIVRLFDFLLQCSFADRAPKEIEIAGEVFGRHGSFVMIEDASVRVYVHRLRRKLEEFYAANATDGPRLTIGRGRYQLVLTPPAEHADQPAAPPGLPDPPAPDEPPQLPPPRPDRRALIGGMAAIGMANLAGWAIWGQRRRPDRLAEVAQTGLWRPFFAGDRPIIIAVGDYYMFGEAPDSVQVSRLVREFEINSREDLDAYLMAHPDMNGRYVDLDLHYLPVGIARALQTISPITARAAPPGPKSLSVRTISELTAEQLKEANIVYLGFLSGLGLLRDPLFGVSSFRIGASYDEIVDRRTNLRYQSDWSKVADGGSQRRDYSYVASLPGPTGNRVLIIAGTRDAALMQAADVVADPKMLRLMSSRVGDADAFEALLKVNTIGSINLDSTLVVARPLPGTAAWQGPPDGDRFPDQFQPGAASPRRR